MKPNIASIQARLKNYSKQQNKTHTFTLVRYFQERLLYRLSKSTYRENFILKGGALVYAIRKSEATRHTLDIDLLGKQIQSDEAILKKVFSEICNIQFTDGVVFDAKNIQTSEIIKEGNYKGIRVKIPVTLGNIKQILQVDIGFGDPITPAPVEMDYPTLIKMDSPNLWVYSVETLIAEKFHAMINLGEHNSRMKDFYDVFTILRSGNYNENHLREAIKNTFKKRATSFTKDHALFSTQFYENENRNQQWTSFLIKAKLDDSLQFKDVLVLVSDKLKMMYEAV